MNFTIPKNYKFKAKLFGLIDYETAAINSIWAVILYFLVNAIFSSLTMKVYFFIGLFMPFLLFSIIGVHRESIISLSIYIFKFYKNQKVYVYKKRNIRFSRLSF